ncbi:MAG: FGGY-family carbohydrate kinase [Oscillospiraceae bacterium]|nr:FGGY-family carbohydrate kinase [Oscillospiraceae bacterium]
MDVNAIKSAILEGRTSLGIELGSTRIKAVLTGEDNTPIASGGYSWENRLENGVWTYHLDDVWAGLRGCYRQMADEVMSKYGVELTTFGSMGFSGMMHGYLVFDKAGNQIADFRTWRNTITEQSAAELTELFGFNVPQRWSIAHLDRAVLIGEEHVKDIDFMTTLAGYVHWMLTGEKVLGIGEASGVFPIDSNTNDYDAVMVDKFNERIADKNFAWELQDILPKVQVAGENAGKLTEEGAKLLDPSGKLKAGIPFCPPEGDAGTGMVATNSVAERTGNVSAGTSIFAMIVLEKALSKVYPEIDMVTTPSGKPVAMVHCNNCTTDLDSWISLLKETVELMTGEVSVPKLYDTFYNKALEGDADCGGLLSYNYYSGEHTTGFEEGRPLFVKMPDSKMNLANFARTILFSTMATLKLGMNILTEKESVCVDQLLGHGGLFKTKGVGQKLMAGALNVPVAVMATAGEGGAWGIALLASYMKNKTENQTLEDFLSEKVFAGMMGDCVSPDQADTAGFEKYIERYKAGLAIERAAVDNLK